MQERVGLVELAPGQVDASPVACIGTIMAPRSHFLARGLRDCVLGEDPLEREHLWQRMYEGSIFFGRRGAAIEAMSGIDLALWDIAGKAFGVPAYKLAGGGFHKKVRAYSSFLWGDTPEQTAEAAKRFVGQGFTACKFGWNGWGSDWAKDVEQMAAVSGGVAAYCNAGDLGNMVIDSFTHGRRKRRRIG